MILNLDSNKEYVVKIPEFMLVADHILN